MTAPTNAEPETRTVFKIGESPYELVPPAKMSYPELRELKRVSQGMTPAEVERALVDSDPDAWFATILVSMRRVAPQITEAKLEEMLGDRPLVSVIATLENEGPEVADDSPPEGEQGGRNGTVSGETTPQLSTLVVSGSQGF